MKVRFKPRPTISAKPWLNGRLEFNKSPELFFNKKLTWELQPGTQISHTGVYHIWKTTCERYRVVRSIPFYDNLMPRFVPEYQYVLECSNGSRHICWWAVAEQPKGYPKGYQTLQDALRAVENFHCLNLSVPIVQTNEDDIVSKAMAAKLADLPLRAVFKPSSFPGEAKASIATKHEASESKFEELPKNFGKPTRSPTGKVGVIAFLEQCLRKATKEKPITRKELAEMLKQQFPERAESAMKATVNAQVPTKMKARKIKVVKSGDGFYIDS